MRLTSVRYVLLMKIKMLTQPIGVFNGSYFLFVPRYKVQVTWIYIFLGTANANDLYLIAKLNWYS